MLLFNVFIGFLKSNYKDIMKVLMFLLSSLIVMYAWNVLFQKYICLDFTQAIVLKILIHNLSGNNK